MRTEERVMLLWSSTQFPDDSWVLWEVTLSM